MDYRNRNAAALAALFSCVLPVCAQTATHKKHAKVHKPTVQEQISAMQSELRTQHEEMQAQIDALKSQLEAKQSQAESAAASAATAQQQAAAAQAVAESSSQQNAAAVSSLQQTVASTNVQVEQVNTQQAALKKEVESPVAIHYKGITLTPGGFIAGESVWRQRAMNADIYTNFNATPYPGAGEAHMSEWVPSARQTRLSLIAAGKAGALELKGMIEGDFLSAGTTSNSLQTNSFTFRIRQAWAQASVGHTIMNAGQMWTLATENKKGALAGQEALPLTIDNNFNVGTTWGRQLGYRIQQQFTPGFTLAAAVESSQYQFFATNAPSNFFFGAAGAAPGLQNPSFNYTNQAAPDIIVKASFDPGYGHYEIAGIGRFFRDRYYPNYPSAAGAANDTKFAGGFVANARFPLGKAVDLGLHVTAGDGTGRYGASLLPDVTVHPDGRLEPIHNAQGLFSLEAHPNKKLDLYGYAGSEYAQRTYYISGLGTQVGYGIPSGLNTGCETEAAPVAGGTPPAGYNPGSGTCNGATRVVTEGQAGFWYRPYSGPVGKLQFGAAYGYLTRTGWTSTGIAPKAVNNLVYTSVRYYLP